MGRADFVDRTGAARGPFPKTRLPLFALFLGLDDVLALDLATFLFPRLMGFLREEDAGGETGPPLPAATDGARDAVTDEVCGIRKISSTGRRVLRIIQLEFCRAKRATLWCS